MKKLSKKFLILYMLLAVAIFVANTMVPFTGGDDLLFGIPDAQSNGLIGYLIMVWNRNTRRLFCETGSWLTMHWQGKVVANILNTFMMLALIEGLRRISDVSGDGKGKLIISYISTLASFASINYLIIGYSCFWGSGAVNYLWSAVAMVWCIVCPCKMISGQEIKAPEYVLFLVSTVCVCFSEEQFTVGAVLFIFMCLIVVVFDKRSPRVDDIKLLIIQFIIACTFAIISFLSPGFRSRTVSDTFYPGFSELPLGIHVFRTVQWILNGIINESTLVFAFLLVAVGVMIWYRKRIRAILAFCIAIALTILKCIYVVLGCKLLDIGLPALNVENPVWSWEAPIEENVTWGLLTDFQKASFVFWILIMIISFVLFIDALKEISSKIGLMVFAICVVGFVSLSIMHFSASIYASGSRTFFIFNILVIIAGRIILNCCKKIDDVKKVVIAVTVASISIIISCADIIHYITTRLM